MDISDIEDNGYLSKGVKGEIDVFGFFVLLTLSLNIKSAAMQYNDV